MYEKYELVGPRIPTYILLIDLDGGYRLEICPGIKRDKQTLKALITKHVADESTIMIDCWKSYLGLDKAGFQHLTVNHKYNFVDPDTWANTQKIEYSWRYLRNMSSRGGITKDKLSEHLSKYMWRKDIRENNRDAFEVLIEDINYAHSNAVTKEQ